jgi:hypothetical protein
MIEGWTFATLIAWITAKFDVITATLEERAKAITVAFASFEKRMDTTNEWRGALDDQAKTMASKQELSALDDRVEKVEAALLTHGGVVRGQDIVWKLIAAASAIAAVVAVMMRR